jgi:hypothetical protein
LEASKRQGKRSLYTWGRREGTRDVLEMLLLAGNAQNKDKKSEYNGSHL